MKLSRCFKHLCLSYLNRKSFVAIMLRSVVKIKYKLGASKKRFSIFIILSFQRELCERNLFVILKFVVASFEIIIFYFFETFLILQNDEVSAASAFCCQRNCLIHEGAAWEQLRQRKISSNNSFWSVCIWYLRHRQSQ